jgi:hypothetical protein
MVMDNNTSFAQHVEQLILSDKLTQSGALLVSFFREYNLKNATNETLDLQKKVVQHVNNLNDLNYRLRQKSINETDAAAIEKEIWIAFQRINNQVRYLININHALTPDLEQEYISTYQPKPETWHHAGWLPLAVAAAVVGVAFLIGLDYNSKRLKTERAEQQAAIDSKNGVVRQEGTTFKLVEEKMVTGADDAVNMAVKAVKGTPSGLEIKLDIKNKFKVNMRQLNVTLVNIAQNGSTIKAVETAAALGEIAAIPNDFTEKTLHFNFAVGDDRQFLLLCKFITDDAKTEKSIAVPFQIR